ncbi:MAG: threonylcarbamoyl-AMP synthase [Candidatus Omnitrophica bacterium CG_4_9_14_0_2_um_filter_42_8]|nr:MAG: threonylcarbamoyl-AMP synthase [Candidatus Omnitrophica bacterium CG22_combo_CG10-13_8_21_14_all_43_16]PJC48373.1 MAG: threonylcarbamoyl-AMP synthase [Candidatus Omnitrophica bacterium CG_4_9_14_0_2_um_filter_42_8]
MNTKVIKLNPDFPEERLIKEAAVILKNGGLVVFPTETVYGIAANALNKDTLKRLYEIKKRPQDKPFSVHIADFGSLRQLEISLSKDAERIARRFWPGPLTLVALNNKKEKIGLRMPDNIIAFLLIKKAGVPVVAPSANLSGSKPPVSIEEVLSGMDGHVDMILDGGRARIGIESTVMDVTEKPFKILRQGAIPQKEALTDYALLFVCAGNSCRSVMAKGLMGKLVDEAGFAEKMHIDSAGISTFAGIGAAPNTVSVMKEEGVDVAGHIGKNINKDILKRSDIIFVMEKFHKDFIINIMPETKDKIRLLREGQDIPDPIGRSLEEYRSVKKVIKEEVQNIFLEIFKEEKK